MIGCFCTFVVTLSIAQHNDFTFCSGYETEPRQSELDNSEEFITDESIEEQKTLLGSRVTHKKKTIAPDGTVVNQEATYHKGILGI